MDWGRSYNALDPFPPRARARMVWCVSGALAVGAANTLGAEVVFVLNGAFDPSPASAHQPYGWDQMAAIFNRYRVDAVTVDLRTMAPTVGTTNSFFPYQLAASVRPSTDALTLTGMAIATADEEPQTHVEYLNRVALTHIRKRFTMAQIEGLSPQQYAAQVQDYAALVTANPARTIALHLAVATDTGGTPTDVTLLIRFEFEVEFFDRVTLAAS